MNQVLSHLLLMNVTLNLIPLNVLRQIILIDRIFIQK